MHELANFRGGDDILFALQDQGWHRHLGQVSTVIGGEGHPRKSLGDFRIRPAEAVSEFLAEFRAVRIAHDGRRHRRGPTHVVVLQELK